MNRRPRADILRPVWLVCLTVRHGFWVVRLITAINSMTIPWHSPDIFLEDSAPDKLSSYKVLSWAQSECAQCLHGSLSQRSIVLLNTNGGISRACFKYYAPFCSGRASAPVTDTDPTYAEKGIQNKQL